MKLEGYFSNVWFTVVFGTPVLALVYFIADKSYGFQLNGSGAALLLYFMTVCAAAFIPGVILHYQVYRKLGKTKLSPIKIKLLFALTAVLVLLIMIWAIRLLPEPFTFFLYPFRLTVVCILYIASIIAASLIYKLNDKKTED